MNPTTAPASAWTPNDWVIFLGAIGGLLTIAGAVAVKVIAQLASVKTMLLHARDERGTTAASVEQIKAVVAPDPAPSDGTP